jgi:hypothetical protein
MDRTDRISEAHVAACLGADLGIDPSGILFILFIPVNGCFVPFV